MKGRCARVVEQTTNRAVDKKQGVVTAITLASCSDEVPSKASIGYAGNQTVVIPLYPEGIGCTGYNLCLTISNVYLRPTFIGYTAPTWIS